MKRVLETTITIEEVSNGKEYYLEGLGALTDVRQMITSSIIAMGVLKEDTLRFQIAMEEAGSNAITHGNLGVSAEERKEWGIQIADNVESITDSTILSRTVVVRAEFERVCIDESSQELYLQVMHADDGDGFDRAEVADPTAPENIEDAGGRGLMLMNAFSDTVTFNDAGNSVVMTKKYIIDTSAIDEQE